MQKFNHNSYRLFHCIKELKEKKELNSLQEYYEIDLDFAMKLGHAS